MTIGSIFTAKELDETYQPLLLCELLLVNGEYIRLSTHPLGPTYLGTPTAGSYAYGGNEWSPRVLNQDVAAQQSMSNIGISAAPQVTLTLADPDKVLFATELSVGFKGAILKMYSIMWDANNSATGSFSSDSPAPVKFIGTCSAASFDDRTLTIVSTSLLAMSQTQLPPIRIQPLCPWSFPTTAADRLAGASDRSSPFWNCGYSPDIATYNDLDGNPVSPCGNYADSLTHTVFTSCDYSNASCIERLGNSAALIPIKQDESNRPTGRFGGSQWIPNQNSGLQRPYVTGKWTQIINATNETRYGDFVPLVYGTTWTEPEVMGVWGDGNYSYFEMLLHYGMCWQIIQLVVNGVKVDWNPPAPPYPFGEIPSPAIVSNQLNNCFITVNRGLKNGVPDTGTGWGSKGDPYGSMAAIWVKCLVQLAPQNAIPQVQCLLQGGTVRVYSTPTEYNDASEDGATQPPWVLLDLLKWSNWNYDDINIQSFIDAAAVCNTQIYFDRQDGSYANIYQDSAQTPFLRYSTGLYIRQQASIGDVIQGLLNSMKAMLFFDFVSGKLTLMIKQTLADQQPSPIVGSNYDTPVPSVTGTGMTANGYVAYYFNDSNIRKMDDGRSTLQVSQNTVQQQVNDVTIVFQNRENSFSQDSATVIDTEDLSRIGTQVVGTYSLYGAQTFDQVRRTVNTWFAESYRGNPRLNYLGSFTGDTGGTMLVSFETSVKAVHLMIGQIVMFSDVQTGIGLDPETGNPTDQLFRVVMIQPSTNWETAKITLQWHNDNWYQDTYGQSQQPSYLNAQSSADSPPYAWRPAMVVPHPKDVYYKQSELSFDVQLFYGSSENQYANQLNLAITGYLPVNQPVTVPSRPLLELVGKASTSGGYYDNQGSTASYYFSVASKTSAETFYGNNYAISRISNPVVVTVPNNNAIPSFEVLDWPNNPPGYVVFGGRSSESMTFQIEGTGTPSTITLMSAFKEASWGCPNQAFNRLLVDTYEILVAGVFDFQATAVNILPAGGVTYSQLIMNWLGGPFPSNVFNGRELSCLGTEANPSSANLGNPIANLTIYDSFSTDGSLITVIGDVSSYASVDLDPYSSIDSDYFNSYYWNGIGPCFSPSSIDTQPWLDNRWVVRMLPTFGSDGSGNYFEDSLLVNPGNPVYSPVRIVGATNTSPVALSIHPEDTFLGSVGSVVAVVGVVCSSGSIGSDESNCLFTVSAISGTTVTLSGSTAVGTYVSGGIMFLQQQGLQVNSLAGATVFVIAGTGKGMTASIVSNTATRVYIKGAWPFTPDSTTRVIVISSTPVTSFDTASVVNSNVSSVAPTSIQSQYLQAMSSQVSIGSTAGTFGPKLPVGTYFTYTGFTTNVPVNALVGAMWKVISGTGLGFGGVITANTATNFYVGESGSLPFTADSTTRILILYSTPSQQLSILGLANYQFSGNYFTTDASVSYPRHTPLLIRASSVAPSEAVSSVLLDPFREIFLFGRYLHDGYINISLPEALSVGNDVGPLTQSPGNFFPTFVIVTVNTLPVGSPLILRINSAGTPIGFATIPYNTGASTFSFAIQWTKIPYFPGIGSFIQSGSMLSEVGVS